MDVQTLVAPAAGIQAPAVGYQPAPGSAAARALAWLEAQPSTRWVPTAELAAAIDVERKDLSALLEYARRAGVLAARPAPDDSRRREWCLGDGVPLPSTRPQDEDEEPLAAGVDPADGPSTRMIEVLKRQAPGAWMCTADLAAAAGVTVRHVSGFLVNHLQRGEVERTGDEQDGRKKLWRLRPPEPTALDAAAHRLGASVQAPGVVLPVPSKRGAGAQVAMALSRPDGRSRSKADVVMVLAKGPAVAMVSVPQMPERAMRLALWDTGELVIELEGEALTLSAGEVARLQAYLARHGGVAA